MVDESAGAGWGVDDAFVHPRSQAVVSQTVVRVVRLVRVLLLLHGQRPAASSHTAAEIIQTRADASNPHMGLTSWKGSPDGRIHSSDVTVAKNYLSEEELDHLNQLVSGFLDAAELRVKQHTITTMAQCVELCNQYIALTGGQVLTDRGHVSKSRADSKVREEFRRFNLTQESDFDRFVKRVEQGET